MKGLGMQIAEDPLLLSSKLLKCISYWNQDLKHCQ